MKRDRAIRRGAALTAAALLLGGAACGPPGTPPKLSNLRCATADACQSTTDPFRLNLAVDFSDPDGDLAYGTWRVFTDDASQGDPGLLEDVFAASDVAEDAQSGVLWLDVPLSLSNLHDGLEFTVAVEMEDGAGHASNRPGIRFSLALH